MSYSTTPMKAWPEERTCKTCKHPFTARVSDVMGHQFGSTQCDGCAARAGGLEDEATLEEQKAAHEAKVKGWLATCGLASHYQDATFATWQKSADMPKETTYDACVEYAERFPVNTVPFRHPSFWLHSKTNGMGKTHLAAAITRRVMERSPREMTPVRYVSGPELQFRVRRANEPVQFDTPRETEADIYDRIRGVPLLVLDDVGDPSPAEWSRRVYHHVIEQRYSAGLPVVICTVGNTGWLEKVLGGTPFQRLKEMTRRKQHELKRLYEGGKA